jgi:hypothetical protein
MADLKHYNFSGKLTFKNPVTDKELKNMFPKKIGGDQADIEDFFIFENGSFDGMLASYHNDLNSDDVANILIAVLMVFDENTNRIIHQFIELNT